MKLRRNTGIALIAVALLALFVSSFWMVTFEQPRRAEGSGATVLWVWDYHVREAGYGRLTLALVGLAILFCPFRRGERWAWLALTAVLVFFMLPAFVLRVLVPFPGWHIFSAWMFEAGLPKAVFLNMVFPFLMALGLCLCLPEILKGAGRPDRGS